MEIKNYELVFFARSQASTRKLSAEEIAVYVQGKWGGWVVFAGGIFD